MTTKEDTMKYVLLLTRGAWQEEGSEQERAEVFGGIVEWFTKHRADGTIVEANQLREPGTATTVVVEEGRASMIDRPLLEAKEAIGGYAIVEVPDLDAALELAASFPVPDGKVEVRPIVER
ncbi:YciI family protein [Streptomyces fodineus]|nr:YciI family protein [Streptomyces fodineus]